MTEPLSISQPRPLENLLAFPPLTVTTKAWLTIGVMIAADILALVMASLLSMGIRSLIQMPELSDPSLFQLYRNLSPALCLFVLAYAARGLYPAVAVSAADELRRLTFATSQVYLAAGAVIFLFGVANTFSREIFGLAWMLSLILVPLVRALLRVNLAALPWWGYSALIVGSGESAQQVIETLKQHPHLGLKPVAILADTSSPTRIQDLPVLGTDQLIPQLARQMQISYAILAMPGIPRGELLTIMEHHRQWFPHVMVIPDLMGFASLWVEAKDLGGILGLEFRQQLLNPLTRLIKRGVDLIGTLLVGILLLPIWLVIACCVKLDSPGPLLFTQERLGQEGQRFRAYKFRSMYVNAEARLQEILSQDPSARQEYEIFHKLRQDPRVTRVGRFLRKYSLDEFPQLLNVLRGEMSLVGPRAYIPLELSDMNGSEDQILQVLPGITGLWQVSGRNQLSFAQRLQLDAYYVRNWSIWLDATILARTVWVVISGHGAH